METEYSTWAIILFGFLILGAVLLYFLPSFLVSEKCPYKWGVFLVNLLFGWTLVGWVGALIWGMSWGGKRKKVVHQTQAPEPDKYDKLARLKELLDKGAITETEYNTEKQQILSGLQTSWNVSNPSS